MNCLAPRYFFRLLLLLPMTLPFNAYALTIITEQDPPYSFTDKDGAPSGFAVEVVNEIQQRLGGPIHAIRFNPWARAYRRILNEPNTVVFTMTRTKGREDLFQWVGPIVENDWVLIGRKNAQISLSDLSDARKIPAIGVVRDYAWTDYLLQQGFNNLDQVTERKVNVLKLNNGRINAFVSADSSYASEILDNGLDPDNYEILLKFNTVQMYIAHSKLTDQSTVATWQAALDEMKADGTFQSILVKWLPANKIPSPARPADF